MAEQHEESHKQDTSAQGTPASGKKWPHDFECQLVADKGGSQVMYTRKSIKKICRAEGVFSCIAMRFLPREHT